jgi:hypothetical protein
VAFATVLHTGKLPVRPGPGDGAVLVVHDRQSSAIDSDDVDLQQQPAEYVIGNTASLYGQPDWRAIWSDTDDESGLHHDYEVWLESWRRTRRSTRIGTTVPVRTPVPDVGTGCGRALEAAGHGPRSGGRRHQRPSRLWHVGTDLLRPGRMAGP